MAGVSKSRAVLWPPHTSSPLPDLRFHHGKCAESIECEDGKMCPTTISPLMIWIEHDTQLVRDLADKVLVLHYGKELALGAVNQALSDAAVMATYIGKR